MKWNFTSCLFICLLSKTDRFLAISLRAFIIRVRKHDCPALHRFPLARTFLNHADFDFLEDLMNATSVTPPYRFRTIFKTTNFLPFQTISCFVPFVLVRYLPHRFRWGIFKRYMAIVERLIVPHFLNTCW